ncbi:MAG: NAD(P)-binding domain-containing protein [Thermoanaerobaculia bacterium]|nr:NAD(P)-binding domain-containing protein [Thermoanaerobaculia bacterium]
MAVVGAGPSGLVAAKELLAEGHRPVVFERAADLGGVFRFGERDGVVWESCRLTSSGLLTAFSDFPVAADGAGHLRVGQYVDYLRRYCDAFAVTPHLRFETTVERVERDGDTGWIVTVVGADGRRSAERFDAVAVCSGLHQDPHLPAVPGLASFPGDVLHGSRYRRPEQVAGRRVLVVGAGESGADIVAEVARHAAETVLSLRRGVAVVTREAFGVPRDFLTSRLLNSPADWIFQTRHPKDDRKRRVYRALFLPFVVVDKALQLLYRFAWEFLPLLVGKSLAEVRENLATRRLTMQLLAESGGTVNEQFGTKTDEFVRALAAGRCRRAPGLARFDGRRAVFADGSEMEPDLVVFCTGFETRLPFLDPAIAAAPRYLHTFDPGTGATLGFVGLLRPAFGAIPPLAELQARWFALVCSGRRALPTAPRMAAEIERWQRHRDEFFRAVRGRLDHLVEFTVFCEALAGEIGCRPTAAALARERARFRRRFFAGPFVAAQYRLVGPHAQPELARRLIESLPVVHPWPDRANLHLRWFLSRLLRRLLGEAYAPKLELAPDAPA